MLVIRLKNTFKSKNKCERISQIQMEIHMSTFHKIVKLTMILN